jgi:hypothetical protein
MRENVCVPSAADSMLALTWCPLAFAFLLAMTS